MPKLFRAVALAALALAACSADRHVAADTSAPPAAASSVVAPAVRARIAATLGGMAPGSPIQSLETTPIAGLYQVVVQGQVLYLTGDGRFVIQGDAFDVATHTPLNRVTLNRLRREAIAKLSPDQMIRFAPAHPKYTVTVFTDIDCPYCRAFHANIEAINKLGIAVDYLFWPRSGLGTPSARKATDVWCAPDRRAALTRAFEGTSPAVAECGSPVARDFHLGVDLGVDGTPTIIADNGMVLGGYVDPRELLRRLQQAHAGQPVQGG